MSVGPKLPAARTRIKDLPCHARGLGDGVSVSHPEGTHSERTFRKGLWLRRAALCWTDGWLVQVGVPDNY